jgi:hypothetical protein
MGEAAKPIGSSMPSRSSHAEPPTAGAVTVNGKPYRLPLNAGTSIIALHADQHTLTAWPGYLLFCAYTLAALAASAIFLIRRDA